jgi:hypothetical protein
MTLQVPIRESRLRGRSHLVFTENESNNASHFLAAKRLISL